MKRLREAIGLGGFAPLRPNVLYVLFALSGFTGLIYESVWTQYLKLFLGHAAYAQALVLAIFMGGLALGSWICSTRSFRWKNLLRGYALTEGVIGLSALVFHNVFEMAVQISYSGVIPHLNSPFAIDIFKWTLATVLIFPQTILLGMTFPLMAAGTVRLFPEKSGSSLSMLYFTNSLGAAIGVLASGFVLISLVGLPGTIRIAGLVNVVLCIYVWVLVKRLPGEYPSAGPAAPLPAGSPDRGVYWLLLAASALTGVASFIYEIVWIRMLSLVLGSSTHAFELMLGAFILGIAFGGLWMRSRILHIRDTLLYLAGVQVIMGALALMTLPLYGSTFLIMDWLIKVLPTTDAGYVLFNLASGGLSLMIMFPATFFAGMTLPLITSSLLQRGHGERSIGAVYAVNTCGAIIGVFFAIHAGMTMLGLKGLMVAGAGLDIALGLALFWRSESRSMSVRMKVITTALSLAGLVLAAQFAELDAYKMASGVYRFGGLISRKDSGLLYHKDGKTATVSVLTAGSTLNIRTNGKVDAEIQMDPSRTTSSDELTMVLLAGLPMSLNPQAKRVAAIGFGTGLTTSTYLQSNTVEVVDTIEIEPAMVEGAQNFRPIVDKAYTDPRSRIYIDDAKTFFSSHKSKYDIIVSEPSNPWVSGVSGLFSREFYRFIGGHLTRNGIFCQWLQLYEIDVNLVTSVLKALSESFDDYIVYALGDTDLIIMAGNGAGIPEPDFHVADNPGIADALRWVHVNTKDDFRIRKIGDKKIFRNYLDAYPVRANSDYYPVLDQNAARTRFRRANAGEFAQLASRPLPIAEMLGRPRPSLDLTNVSLSEDFEAALAGYAATALRDYYMSGDVTGKYSHLSPGIREKAAELKDIFFTNCSAGPDERTSQMYDTLAIRMIPYLSPDELGGVWARLESGTCMGSFTPVDRQWMALLKAVGKRDAAGMARLSETMLEKGQGLPKGPMSYLVATGMLGYLMQEDREHSLRLWQRYRPMIYGAEEPTLFFRLLVSMSMKR